MVRLIAMLVSHQTTNIPTSVFGIVRRPVVQKIHSRVWKINDLYWSLYCMRLLRINIIKYRISNLFWIEFEMNCSRLKWTILVNTKGVARRENKWMEQETERVSAYGNAKQSTCMWVMRAGIFRGIEKQQWRIATGDRTIGNIRRIQMRVSIILKMNKNWSIWML